MKVLLTINPTVAGYFSRINIIFGDDTLSNFASSQSDIYIVKYSPSGNVLWAKKAGAEQTENAYAIATGSNADIYVTGTTSSSQIIFGDDTLVNSGSATQEYFIAWLDSSGNPLWVTGAEGTGGDVGLGITGNLLLTNSFSSPEFMLDISTFSSGIYFIW